MPAQLAASGSRAMLSCSTRTFIQSSSRPIMSEQTGLSRLVSLPAASARRRPRSTASADGDALGDGEHDRDVDDDAARGRVLEGQEARGGHGNFTWMFGASVLKWTRLVGHPRRVAVVGRVRLERQPALRPVVGVEHGLRGSRRRVRPSPRSAPRSARPRTRPGSPRTSRGPAGPSGPSPSSSPRARSPGSRWRPVPPRSTAYSSSATAQESFQKSVGVASTIRRQRAVDGGERGGHEFSVAVRPAIAAAVEIIDDRCCSCKWSSRAVTPGALPRVRVRASRTAGSSS